jgi:acetyl-CoA carboxylase carboxyltransferase component
MAPPLTGKSLILNCHVRELGGVVAIVRLRRARVCSVARENSRTHAALAGCGDVLIATRNTTIGMGGPAMIEGGGLGVFRSEDVGPIAVQAPNGVVDLAVDDEAAAVAAAK